MSKTDMVPETRTGGEPSTDNPDEEFDLVDADDNVIGRVRRGDAHRDPGLIHRSVQVLVFGHDGRVLLQLRSPSKDLFPGYFCASASGHVAAGEDYATTAEREVAEELGLTLPLIFVGTEIVRSERETEITALFLARSDGPFQFHPIETSGGAFFTLQALHSRRAVPGESGVPLTPAAVVALDAVERLECAGRLAELLATL